MLRLQTPASVDHARIQTILDAGCPTGCSGEAALVRRRVAGGSWQVWVQCRTCGRHLGSALPQAVHVDWRNYPESDPSIAARYYGPVNQGPSLAIEANHLLGRDDLRAYHQVVSPTSERMLGGMALFDLGVGWAARLLSLSRTWVIGDGHDVVGFVGASAPNQRGIAHVAVMGVEVHQLPSGCVALIRPRDYLTFLAAAGRASEEIIRRTIVKLEEKV